VDWKSRRCGAGRTLNDATIAPSGPKALRGCFTFIDDGLPNREFGLPPEAQRAVYGSVRSGPISLRRSNDIGGSRWEGGPLGRLRGAVWCSDSIGHKAHKAPKLYKAYRLHKVHNVCYTLCRRI
jgi:hypothetical protein